MTFIENQAAAWKDIHQRFAVNETSNGPGSTNEATEAVRRELPGLLRRYGVEYMLDVPCGDWNWMRSVELGHMDYVGWDVEQHVVWAAMARSSRNIYGTGGTRVFERQNILTVNVPNFDLILCRDFLMHLPNRYISNVLSKFVRSETKWLLVSNHPGANNDRVCPLDGGEDDRPGYYCQPVDLEAAPFNLRGRTETIRESPEHELVLFDLGEN